MSFSVKRMVLGYVVAVLGTLVATLVRFQLNDLFGEEVPLITYFAAVVLAAWVAGLTPGLLTTVLSSFAALYFFMTPTNSFQFEDLTGVIELGFFLFSGTLISIFCETLHRAQQRVARQNHQLSIEIRERENAENAERVQRNQLRITLSSIGDAVIVSDCDGRVVSLNPVAEQLTGWPNDAAQHQPLDVVFNIVDEETLQPVENPAIRAIELGTVEGLARRKLLITRQGSKIPIDESVAPIRDETNAINGCVLVFRDVSRRRVAEQKLKRSEQELADCFDNANIGMHWVGFDGTILRVNRFELEMLGYSIDEFVGRCITEFHVDQNRIADLMEKLKAGETVRDYSSQLRARDGSIKDVLINSTAKWEDGKFVHSRCFTVDVTDQKRASKDQALLASIIESSDDAFITKTLDGKITSWNEGAERLFGYQASEVIGRSVMIIVPHDRENEETEIHQRLRQGERIPLFETIRIAKSGAMIDVSLTISPIFDGAGQIIGASTAARDDRARKRAEAIILRNERRLRLLIDALHVVVIYIDRRKRYRFFNDTLIQWFGLDSSEVIGKTVEEVIGTKAFEQIRDKIERALAGENVHFEAEVPYRLGGSRAVEVRYIPDVQPDGSVEGFIGLIEDITERIKTEQALRQADRRKDEFLATLSHELRNPLAPIRHALELIKLSEANPQIVLESRSIMERQLGQMVRLIDDLLDLSRISRGKLQLRLESVDLASVIETAVEAARPLTEQMHQVLDIRLPQVPIQVVADPIRLAQVFSNLLNNASKFGGPESVIRLVAEQGDESFSVIVQDSGIGIPADKLGSIFEMFSQVDQSQERVQTGLGIGLTLAKRIIEMHGGTITVQSEGINLGSEFRVQIPLGSDSPIHPSDDSSNQTECLEMLRVMIVDDYEDNAKCIALLLQLQGHETSVANDGLKAIELAAEFKPDLILLDLGLPGLNGFEVCRKIRQQPWGQAITIAAVTGWGQDSDRKDSSEAGFNAHLVKPVDQSLLKSLLVEVAAKKAGSPSQILNV